MTFSRIKPYGWQVNEKVTSPQLNQLDLDHSNALDKTGDDIATGGGISGEIGILSTGSIQTQGGSISINSGDVQYVNAGAAIEVSGTGSFVSMLSNSTLNVSPTAELNLQGTQLVDSGALVQFYSGSTEKFLSGSTVDGYGTVNMESTSILNLTGTVNSNAFANWITPQVRTICQGTNSGLPLTGTWTPLVQGVSSNAVGNQWVCQLDRLHNGATLNLVVVTFQVWESHSGVPANLPSLSVLRYNNSNLQSEVALGIPDPQAFFPPPASGSAWYDMQNTQYLVYECIHNNVIDNSQYTYYVVITDESGSNSLPDNNYGNITLSFNAINTQGWQI